MDGAAAAAAAAAAARARKKNVSLPGPPYAVLGGLPDYSDRPHSPVSTLGAGGKWFRLDEASSRALGTTPVAPATPCEALTTIPSQWQRRRPLVRLRRAMAVAAAVEKAAAMRLEVGVTAAAVARRLMFTPSGRIFVCPMSKREQACASVSKREETVPCDCERGVNASSSEAWEVCILE